MHHPEHAGAPADDHLAALRIFAARFDKDPDGVTDVFAALALASAAYQVPVPPRYIASILVAAQHEESIHCTLTMAAAAKVCQAQMPIPGSGSGLEYYITEPRRADMMRHGARAWVEAAIAPVQAEPGHPHGSELLAVEALAKKIDADMDHGTGRSPLASDVSDLTRAARSLALWARRVERSIGSAPEVGLELTEDEVKLVAHDSAMVGRAMAQSMADLMHEEHARNYLVCRFWHPMSGRIEVVVQRVGKLSPHEGRLAAEQHLRRAIEILKVHNIPWDGPTEFLPDQAPPRVKVKDDAPWIHLDPQVEPNILRCERCTASQVMPMAGVIDVLKSIVDRFHRHHAHCAPPATKAS